MGEVLKLIIAFCSGGLAGAFAKHFLDKHNNKVQLLDCQYVEDEVISKLPITYEDMTHENLQSKKFYIINTTNKDIAEMKVIFSFESRAIITKCVSYSKDGTDIPKGKIINRNECHFTIKNLNRKDKIEVNFEIGNIQDDLLNVTESSILGIKLNYVDKRKSVVKKTIKLVEKRALDTNS